ncbi:MAG TPA: hypothetical protein VFI28_13525 [Candidatus Limnocylindrales bacterium]|nr:hypothetical protein [Candidatus Limnocylindrales bacterium]
MATETMNDAAGDETVDRADDERSNRPDPRAIASDLAAQAPAAMNQAMGSAADALNEGAAAIQSSSDEALAIGTALSTGIAIGLILGGANRLLVGAALVPTAAMGFTLLSRYTEVRPRGMAGGARKNGG